MAKEPVAINFPKSNLYMEVLEGMAQSIDGDQKLKQTLAVPFVLTCGASLECLLNDRIISDLWEVWFDDHYRPIVDGYLSMGLRGKLDTVVPLLTDNKFMINRSHPNYQALTELITQRNRIAHNKSFFEEVEFDFEKDDIAGSRSFTLPQWFAKKMRDVTFELATGPRPLNYLTALKHFQSAFFKTYRDKDFQGNDLILPREG